MERQVVGESLVLLCVVGTRSDAKVLDSRTDGFVLLQHLRQFPPQRVGHRQDVGHVRREVAARKLGEKPEGRQGDLLLPNEVRMEDPGKFLRRWTDATRRARRFLQRGVNGVVLCLDAPRNFDLVRGHRLLPSPPSDAAVRFDTSASQVPYGLCRRPLSIDPLHEAGRQGILHDSNSQDTIVLQHLSRGIARFLERGIR